MLEICARQTFNDDSFACALATMSRVVDHGRRSGGGGSTRSAAGTRGLTVLDAVTTSVLVQLAQIRRDSSVEIGADVRIGFFQIGKLGVLLFDASMDLLHLLIERCD